MVLTVDEPDRGHGDGEERPRAHVHLDQCCCQGKQQQDDQQAAQNPHRVRDTVCKGAEWGLAGPRPGGQGRQEVQPGPGQRAPGEMQGAWRKDRRSPLGLGGAASAGRDLSPLIQEGVEESEEQQGQLGQQRHPVVEVEGIRRARVVGAQGRGSAVGPHQPPLEVLPDAEGGGTGSPSNLPSGAPSLLLCLPRCSGLLG